MSFSIHELYMSPNYSQVLCHLPVDKTDSCLIIEHLESQEKCYFCFRTREEYEKAAKEIMDPDHESKWLDNPLGCFQSRSDHNYVKINLN